jgi:DNA primase
MNQQQIELLQKIFPDNVSNSKEFTIFCPQCQHHKRKLVISLEKKLFHCWICNYGGHVSKLIRSYGGESAWKEWNRLETGVEFDTDLRSLLADKNEIVLKETIKLPLGAQILKNCIPSVIAQKSIAFLNSRGINYKTIRTFNIHYCEEGKYRDRVIVPSYNLKGRVDFFVARSIYNSPDIMKYVHTQTTKKDIIFNELFITWDRPVILVEGPFDAINIKQNSVPLLGSTLASDSELFKKIMNYKPNVYLMFDNDKPGQQGTITAGKLLTDWGINTFIIEYNKKDPGELTQKEFFQALKNRKRFTQSDVLRRILE